MCARSCARTTGGPDGAKGAQWPKVLKGQRAAAAMPGAGELCREGGPYRIVCGGEGGAEDIADGLEDAALVVLNTPAQEVFVAGQGRAHGFGNGMVLFKPPLP